MSDLIPSSGTIETRADLDNGDAGEWAFWMGQSDLADREARDWVKRGKMVLKRYRDERPTADNNIHKFNILWSNVQTMMPTLYANTPKPDVMRRFLDQDDIGRLASMLLERCISFSLETHDFDSVMSAVVEDRLLPGRGVARVLYVPHFGDEIEDDASDNEEFEESEDAAAVIDGEGDEGGGKQDDKKPPLREVTYEEVVPDYVFWQDYREGPARTWKEVPWVSFDAWLTKDEVTERFGAEMAKKIQFGDAARRDDERDKSKPVPDIYKKALVREFWDKIKKRVVWIAPATPDLILDKKDDPLGLPDFFPCPDPLRATTTNDKRVPIADYVEYQDQARELDRLTGRIDKLTQALKVSGIYPGEDKQMLQQLIDDGIENKLIPVHDWGHIQEKGGLDGMIQWVPIKQIAETLVQLYDARERTKGLLYEITGIGDIMRGQTNPNETMGAQQLKANFSTRRIVPQQKKVAKFARDMIRIMGAIISLQFDPKTISRITGYPQLAPLPPLPPEPPAMIPRPMPAPGMVPHPVAPTVPAASVEASSAPMSQQHPALPPQALQALAEGHITTFGNGQRWTRQNGQPVRMS